ncbi:MAG: EFR1 family ferrodoxin [Treponema sp.]|nr:EFR1 family ferrodoxin [Treponema sp.]
MIKIYYFSGTGNSLWSAKKIAQGIGNSHSEAACEIINIGVEAQKSEIIIEADAVVMVFPSYAYGLPLIVRRFVKNAIFRTPYLAAFVTYGSSPRGTLGILRRILKQKGIGKWYFGGIPAVENYLALFGPPNAETLKSRILMQEKATEEAARAVTERRENSVSMFFPYSALVSWLFYRGLKIFYRYYRVSDNCNGCGICAKICPVSAIAMKNGRPVFSSLCEHCQGCVDICPLRAIQFGRARFGAPGYCHPEIKIADLERYTP